MSRRVFISYSRRDKVRATWLRDSLSTFGHEVWIDEVLEGGESWWSAVLEALQWCEIFVAVMTPHYTASEACTKELEYALQLQRKLLPVQGDTPVGKAGLRNTLSETHWVDIRETNPTAQSDVVRAITRLPAPGPLPDPLPERPSVPISYTKQVREVLARSPLGREAQEWVLEEIEFRNDRGEEAIDLLELLDALGSHDDFRKVLDGRRTRLRAHIAEHGVVKGPETLAPASVPPLAQPAPPVIPGPPAAVRQVKPVPPPPKARVPAPPVGANRLVASGIVASPAKSNKKWLWIGLAVFVIIVALAAYGNYVENNCYWDVHGNWVC